MRKANQRILEKAVLLLVVGAGAAADAAAQSPPNARAVLDEVGIDQRLDAQVPRQLTFRDASGQAVKIDDYLGDKPVVLAPVYYECPMLCTLVLNGLVRALRTLSFDAGDEFDVVAVSFDPDESPQLAEAKKRTYLRKYGRSSSAHGWHFLTGEEPAIRELLAAVGFRYRYDADADQYAHAAGIIVLTPEGRVSRYFYGVEYSARDLRLGLVEASSGNIGTVADQVLLLCYHYDPTTGKYGLLIMRVIRVAGLLTVLMLCGGIALLLRRERRQGGETARRQDGEAATGRNGIRATRPLAQSDLPSTRVNPR